MGSRLTESSKLIEKGFRRKVKKEKWEQTIPSFRNLKIDISFKYNFESIRLIITDILHIENRPKFSKIINISPKGGTFIITQIKCPFCNKIINLNKYWNSYICESEDHEKKIYEITSVEYPPKPSIKDYSDFEKEDYY